MAEESQVCTHRMELVIKLSRAFPARSPPCRMQSVSLTAGESGQTCWIMGMQKAVASNLFKKCVSFRKPPPPNLAEEYIW